MQFRASGNHPQDCVRPVRIPIRVNGPEVIVVDRVAYIYGMSSGGLQNKLNVRVRRRRPNRENDIKSIQCIAEVNDKQIWSNKQKKKSFRDGKMFHPSKHTYLQKALCFGYNQKTVNRLMDKYMGDVKSARDVAIPFPKLSTQNPSIFAPNVDASRAKKAFGNWALPKLKRQMHYPDIEVVMQALNTILDMVYDPERGYEAVRIGLVDKLTNMMLHERDFVREKICMIFYVLAGQEAGRRAMIRRYEILKNLFRLTEDEVETVRHKAQMAVEMISRSLTGTVGLNCADCLVLVLRLIGGAPHVNNDDILLLNLTTLENLLEDDCKVLALEHNAIDILLGQIDHPREDIAGTALSCIGLLCNHPLGRQMSDERGVSNIVCKKLYDERRLIQAKAASAFAFSTVESDARLKACNPCVLDRLMQLFEDFQSSELQLMAAKALTNLAEDPNGRAYLAQEKNQKRIEKVFTGRDEEVEKHRQILLKVIRWKP